MAVDYSKLSDQALDEVIAKLKGGTSAAANVPARVAGLPGLADHRKRFAQEMADNPAVLRRLVASARAEVGTQGEEAVQSYIETVMNRGIARDKSLDATIYDSGYYPKVTIDSVRNGASDTEVAKLRPIIDRVLSGSNITRFATGNESGGVQSGGAPITHKVGGERFVVENADSGWSRKVASAATADSPASILPAGNVIETIDTSKIRQPRASLTRKAEDVLGREDLLLAARANAQDIAQSVIKAGGNLTRDQYTQLLVHQYDAVQEANLIPARKPLPEAVLNESADLAGSPEMLDHFRDLHSAAIKDKAFGFGNWGNPQNMIPGLNPVRQTAIAFDTYKQSLVPIIARGLQKQTGPLSNDDIKNAEKALPSAGDSPETVATKVEQLKYLLHGNLAGKIDLYKDNFDTTALENADAKLRAQLQIKTDQVTADNPAPDTASKFQLYDVNKRKLEQATTPPDQQQPTAPTPQPPAASSQPAVAAEPENLTPQQSADVGRRDVQQQTQFGGFVSPWTTRGSDNPPIFEPEYVGQ